MAVVRWTPSRKNSEDFSAGSAEPLAKGLLGCGRFLGSGAMDPIAKGLERFSGGVRRTTRERTSRLWKISRQWCDGPHRERIGKIFRRGPPNHSRKDFSAVEDFSVVVRWTPSRKDWKDFPAGSAEPLAKEFGRFLGGVRRTTRERIRKIFRRGPPNHSRKDFSAVEDFSAVVRWTPSRKIFRRGPLRLRTGQAAEPLAKEFGCSRDIL
jgi:hypothetical protein